MVSGNRKRWWLGALGSAAFLVLLALLFFFRNRPLGEALFVPPDLARLRALDRQGVLAYTRNEIRSADYSGALRGPYGALWAGEASALDRVLLAAAALEATGTTALVIPGEPPRLAYRDAGWHVVRLDADEPPAVSESRPSGAIALKDLPKERPDLFYQVSAALVLEGAGSQQRIETPEGELLSEWAFQPVLLTVQKAKDGLRLVLNVGVRKVLSTAALTGTRRATLELTWRFGSRSEQWRRELFDEANVNSPGHRAPHAGDGYALVVATGPLQKEVFETRNKMLQSAAHTPLKDEREQELVMLGTSYLVSSDALTAKLAQEAGIQPAWPAPRLVIAAQEYDGGKADSEPGNARRLLSLDVVADEVEARGGGARQFQVSRGLAKDDLETRILFKATQAIVVSASTVLANAAAPSAATPERRLAAIEAEGKRLLAEELLGTQVKIRGQELINNAFTLIAGPAGRQPPRTATITMRRTAEGLDLLGMREEPSPSQAGSLPWDRYVLDPEASVTFGRDARQIARAAEAVLGRGVSDSANKEREPSYFLDFELVRAVPVSPLPIASGSTLLYQAKSGKRVSKLGVLVNIADGSLVGTWVDLQSGRRSDVKGASQPPLALSEDGSGIVLSSFVADPKVLEKGESVRAKVRLATRELALDARGVSLENGGKMKVLPSSSVPLILEWESGDRSLRLLSVSPLLHGRVLDASTDQAVDGAVVEWPDGPRWARTVADGSFALPLTRPLFRRLILVFDKSGSMAFGLDPATGDAAPAGEQRIDALRSALNGLLARVPAGVEVALWSFTTPGGRDYSDPCEAVHTRTEHDFTSNLDEIRQTASGLAPTGSTPLTGAITRILEHVQDTPASREAVVVLLADGDNSCDRVSAAQEYQARKGRAVIHTVGFAIESGGLAERELRDIADVSGGTYFRAGTEQELDLVFRSFVDHPAPQASTVRISAPGYRPAEITLAASDAALEPLEIRMTRRGRDPSRLLTIRHANIADLERVQGLSPKARGLIEERLREDGWSVIIPTNRVGVGAVTAYGWMEMEDATGRMIGRTEDGLHGSIADPTRWPERLIDDVPFISWYQGIVAYTTGSVDAMFRVRNEPDFLNFSDKDLGDFVQANALQFSVNWLSDIGAAHPDAFWGGVCLNFEMQCGAMKADHCDQCLRLWWRDLCTRGRDQLKEEVEGAVGEAAKERLGEEFVKLVEFGRKHGHSTIIGRLERPWNQVVEESIPCDDLLRGDCEKPCPPNPACEVDVVPPSRPHWPCPADHWHYQVYNQVPYPDCRCFLSSRLFGGCIPPPLPVPCPP